VNELIVAEYRATTPTQVRTGLDVLVAQEFAPLRGLRVGLLANPATVNATLTHAIDLLTAAPAMHLAALFGPEHGLFGHAQDLVGVDTMTGVALPVHSLYGDTLASLKPTPEMLAGLDALVIDLPDIGCRYYTFAVTMCFCLEAAALAKIKVFVLDRPNPLNGVTIEGPTLRPAFASFVGWLDVPTRHGLTLGELARLYVGDCGLEVALQIIPCEGWRREMDHSETGLPWVLPSPNMPTLDTAFVYPGQCLIEGTNLSEGRGSTRPFEICGAPWVDGRALADRLGAEGLPGVLFRPLRFQPTFQKCAGRLCGGVQLHVTDRNAFLPVRTGLAVLAALRDLSGSHFAWRTDPYEFVAHIPAIDLLFGSERERLGLEANRTATELAAQWVPEEEAFRQRRRAVLLY
jgi:uncharacterized protein YbbC (DUF1343 family)